MKAPFQRRDVDAFAVECNMDHSNTEPYIGDSVVQLCICRYWGIGSASDGKITVVIDTAEI